MATPLEVQGDINVGRNASVGGKMVVQGNARVGHNLRVDGWLDAPNIKDNNKGVFGSTTALNTAYPSPEEGWYAGVIAGEAGEEYVELYTESAGIWADAGVEMKFNIDPSGILNQFQFDYTAGGSAQGAKRYVEYDFVAGHKYKVYVVTDSDTETEFSLRNNSGYVVNGQNHLVDGSGVRTGVFVCTADATRFYMNLLEDMETGVDFEVELIDMSVPSILSNRAEIEELDTKTSKNESDLFVLKRQLKEDDMSIQKPFTFSVTGHYIKDDGTVGNSDYWKQSNIVAVTKGQIIILKAVGTSPTKNVLIALTDANGSYYIPVAFADSNDITTVKTTCYFVKQDGYVILQYNIIDGDAVVITDSERLQKIEEDIDSFDEDYVSYDYIQDVLQAVHHSEQRDLSTTNRGYRINSDGTHSGATDNWKISNPIHLFANEKIVVECASTSPQYYIIFLTDAEETFYTPLVKAISTEKATYEYFTTSDCYVIVQGKKTNSVPIIISVFGDSLRLIDIENNIQYLMNDEENIPEYVKEERDRVYRKLLSLSNSDAAVVVFNTDQHFTYPYTSVGSNPVYAMRGIKSIVDIAKRIGIDLMVFGGDVAGYDESISRTIDGILGEVNYLNTPFLELNIPCVSLPGNHDAYGNNNDITAKGMYNAHFRRSKWIKNLSHDGTDNCDCMLDDTDKKIRYIFVDVNSGKTSEDRTESYSDFLTSALTSMGSGYKAVIFSHHPLTNEFDGQKYKYNSDDDDITKRGDAFTQPTDLHSIINAHASDIIACISGHAHCDAWGMNSSGVLFIETTSAVHTRRRFSDEPWKLPWKESYGNAKETAFDFFVIDPTAQTIEAVRYGQGTNRKWKYKGTGAGLISYKNCINGIVSVPSVSLVFTNTEDDTDTVTVTADTSGFYEVYLNLNATYEITCSGYTLDVESVEVDGNKEVYITAEADEE